MQLHIITRKPNNYFSVEYLKFLARAFLNKKRGPHAVVASLLRGLDEMGVFYKFNSEIDKNDIIYVNNSLDALLWAINLKKTGKIYKLIAGPNIVVTPDEYDSLITANEIDLYILPSDWNRNWWLSIKPNLAKKLVIWAAGVKDLDFFDNTNKENVLVYRKNVSEDIFKKVINVLEKKKIKYSIINYGKFKQADYFLLLKKTSCLIYLQESESQGIALIEAWANNVPTFIWNNEVLKYKNYFWSDSKISAPYLNNQCGLFFKNEKELSVILDNFFNKKNKFYPRDYYLSNFTDKICAQKFLELINLV